MDSYSIYIQYDPTDDIFIATIPELKGCMAHGNTIDQALKEVGIAKRLWLMTAREVGKDIPRPFTAMCR
ncbi:MAG: type II toxin-antitoxin system HicB family antitoxin [Clostridiales bacterium]|nr:type II toxin-antitoxin system HicB family antitoxin [Clostridiales bacterium]